MSNSTITTVEADGTVETRELTDAEQAELDAELLASAWAGLRAERDNRLLACDWTQLPDAPVDHTAWAAYRQALRDLPGNVTDPYSPTWPAPPGGPDA